MLKSSSLSKMAAEFCLKHQDNCPSPNFPSSHIGAFNKQQEGSKAEVNKSFVLSCDLGRKSNCLVAEKQQRQQRMRNNTFLPHMRNTLTAACHSFRATNFKDY